MKKLLFVFNPVSGKSLIKNNLMSIGCGYGYGSEDELKDADLIVNSIYEIPDAVKKLIEQ